MVSHFGRYTLTTYPERGMQPLVELMARGGLVLHSVLTTPLPWHLSSRSNHSLQGYLAYKTTPNPLGFP